MFALIALAIGTPLGLLYEWLWRRDARIKELQAACQHHHREKTTPAWYRGHGQQYTCHDCKLQWWED